MRICNDSFIAQIKIVQLIAWSSGERMKGRVKFVIIK